MTITRALVRTAAVPLRRPYAVAHHHTDTAAMVLLQLHTDHGTMGLGAATPEPAVNGDTVAVAARELAAAAEALVGLRVGAPEHHAAVLARLPSPAARMALDMALHDLWAKALGLPLVEALGRAQQDLPTSVTLGLGSVADTLAEAREHLAHGFTVLKVKVGEDLALDLERLAALRQHCGPGIALRADGNCGYRPAELLRFLRETVPLDLEFLEQPLPPEQVAAQRLLPAALRQRLMADESLHDERDAASLCAAPQPFGSANLKLAKCGGILAARRIAALAAQHHLPLMWGCMDESRIAIAAALHTALACGNTRWLDLDGHLELSEDFAVGGFTLAGGVLRPLDRPGLGLEPNGSGW